MRVARLVLVAVLLAGGAACSGGDDGDLDAYCNLIRSGHGLVSQGESELDPADMEALVAVAPPDIKSAVEELANTAHDLEEIPDTNLARLFTAAFDPDAQTARERFDDYAVEMCGLDASDIAAGGDSGGLVLAEISDYVSASFADDDWTTKVRYEVDRDAENSLTGLRIVFVVGPDDGEAMKACQALGVWFHAVREAEGVVEVVYDDLVIAQRDNASSACEAV